MQKKIYFNDKPLFLIDEITKEVEEYLHHEDTVFIDEFNIHTIKSMIHEMESSKIHSGVFLHTDVEALINAFKKKLSFIRAAGGFVYNNSNELLLIFRRWKWDLPKGKLDDNETLEACAIREIKEETGLARLQLEKPLCTTYHTYHQFGKHILKESNWFVIKAENQNTFIPQTEEDIEKCEWVSIDNLAPYIKNTHASILDVVNAGIKALHKKIV